MKIGFDAKRAFHNNRGLGNYSRFIIEILSKYYPDNDYFLFNPKTKNKIYLELKGDIKEINPQDQHWKLIPALWRSFGKLNRIKKEKLDIYHGLNQELPIGIQKTHTKSVVTLHDAIFIRYPELYPASYRYIFTAKNKYACKISDKIICISEQTKVDAIKYFGADENKIEVIYQGCNKIFSEPITDEIKQEIKQKYNLPKTYLLSVGAIEKRKNIQLTIAALHLTKNETPLIIVGKTTKYQNELQSLIEKYNMMNQVIFLNNVPTIDLPALYSMADIFIFPSIFEGFGIPILEALTVGTPVITSSGSCFEETAGQYSLYINPSDAGELGDAINQLQSNNDLRDKMINKGKEHALQFTDKSIATQLMNTYQRLF